MTACTLTKEDNGFSLRGNLDFSSVSMLSGDGYVSQLSQLPEKEITLDLQGVRICNSAGLALLFQWQQQLQGQGKTLLFTHVPEQLKMMSGVFGLSLFQSSET